MIASPGTSVMVVAMAAAALISACASSTFAPTVHSLLPRLSVAASTLPEAGAPPVRRAPASNGVVLGCTALSALVTASSTYGDSFSLVTESLASFAAVIDPSA